MQYRGSARESDLPFQVYPHRMNCRQRIFHRSGMLRPCQQAHRIRIEVLEDAPDNGFRRAASCQNSSVGCEPLFMLFDFAEFEVDVYNDIVTKFVQGHAT